MIKSWLDASKYCRPNSIVKGLMCSNNQAHESLASTPLFYSPQCKNNTSTPNVDNCPTVPVTCICNVNVYFSSPWPKLLLPCGRSEWFVQFREARQTRPNPKKLNPCRGQRKHPLGSHQQHKLAEGTACTAHQESRH